MSEQVAAVPEHRPGDARPYRNTPARLFQLLVILAAAFVPRFFGLQWGLPTVVHYFSYHPDENVNAGVVAHLLAGSANPGFFNYPSLLFYLTAGVFDIFGKFWAALQSPHGAAWATTAGIILSGRIVSAFAGMMTAPFVYFLARKHFGEWPGFAAGLLMAFAPLHVEHSHFFTVDVLATFFVVASLHFCSRIWADRPFLIEYVMAGITAGLAASTKYNAGLVILALPVAHYFLLKDREKGKPFWDKRLISGLASMVAAFVLTSPYVLLDFSKAWQDIRFEMHHMATGHGLVFTGVGPGWLVVLKNLWMGAGPAIFSLGILGLAWTFYRRERGALIVGAFMLPLFLLLIMPKVWFARYALPLVPCLAFGAAAPFFEMRKPSYKALYSLIIAGAVIFTVVLSWPLVQIVSRTDIRDEAMHEIDHKTPMYAKVGLAHVPWFYTPPIAHYNAGPLSEKQFWANLPNTYKVFITGISAEKLAAMYPDYYVLSRYEIEDGLRLKKPEYVAFMKELNKLYDQVATFKRSYGLLEKLGPLPHDMRYIAPEIYVYESKRYHAEYMAKHKAKAQKKQPVVHHHHHRNPFSHRRTWYEKLLGLGDPDG